MVKQYLKMKNQLQVLGLINSMEDYLHIPLYKQRGC